MVSTHKHVQKSFSIPWTPLELLSCTKGRIGLQEYSKCVSVLNTVGAKLRLPFQLAYLIPFILLLCSTQGSKEWENLCFFFFLLSNPHQSWDFVRDSCYRHLLAYFTGGSRGGGCWVAEKDSHSLWNCQSLLPCHTVKLNQKAMKVI